MQNSLVVQKDFNLEAVVKQIPGISDNTRATYFHALQSYLTFLKDSGDPIGIPSLENWLKTFDSAKTQNTYLQSMKKILREYYKNDPRYAELESGLQSIKKVTAEESIKESDYIVYTDVQKLIKNSPLKYALIIEALFWTGCRVSELISIKLKNCITQQKVINISIIGKGSKARTVFLTLELFNKIKDVFNGSVYLFEHHACPYERSYISRMIKALGQKILDRKISAHTLRHSKVMYLKDVKKLSPDQIQKAVGHSNVSTTLSYYYHGTPTAEEQGIK